MCQLLNRLDLYLFVYLLLFLVKLLLKQMKYVFFLHYRMEKFLLTCVHPFRPLNSHMHIRLLLKRLHFLFQLLLHLNSLILLIHIHYLTPILHTFYIAFEPSRSFLFRQPQGEWLKSHCFYHIFQIIKCLFLVFQFLFANFL